MSTLTPAPKVAHNTAPAAPAAPEAPCTAPERRISPDACNQTIADRAARARSVQARGSLNGRSANEIRNVADRGVAAGGSSFPHLGRIQQSFGSHNISDIIAHTGPGATSATDALGADAYATGNRVAFSNGSPDVHTAAHEAAHVVQQRGGVQLKGGIGQQGDAYEQHADAVADRVVSGQSSQALLDTVSGANATTAGQAVQRKEKPTKAVSGVAMTRLGFAHDAIVHTKEVLEFGAGNQQEALLATNMNSYYRMKVMRDNRYWKLTDSARELAAANPTAYTAAKADKAKGGNCGEHATVAFDYLRVHAAGQQIHRAAVNGLDHAFVLLGDLSSDSDADLCVSDPWPTRPTATVWEDHFAHTSDRNEINAGQSMTADGKNVKKVIAAGLRLTRAGKQMLQQQATEEETRTTVDRGLGGWVWGHDETHAAGADYNYVEEKSESASETDTASSDAD